MPIVNSTIKIKAPKELKAGEEITITEGLEVPQEAFDQIIRERLAREKEAARQLSERIEALNAENEKLKAGSNGGGTADPKTAERIAALEKLAREQQEKIDASAHKERIGKVVEKLAKDLPAVYRERISVPKDATEFEVESAVKAQQREFEELRKSLGATGKNEDVGAAGSGGAAKDDGGKAKAALEIVKTVPALYQTLKNQDEQTQLSVALGWVESGEVDRIKAASK
jgi:hypothetical protein